MCYLLPKLLITPLPICDHLDTHLQVRVHLLSDVRGSFRQKKNMGTVLICWTTLILVPLCRQGKMKSTLVNRFVFCLMLVSFFHHYSCSYSSLWPPFLACSFLALCPLPSCFWSFLFLLRRSLVRTACCICIGCFHTWVASSVRMTHMIYIKITLLITLY